MTLVQDVAEKVICVTKTKIEYLSVIMSNSNCPQMDKFLQFTNIISFPEPILQYFRIESFSSLFTHFYKLSCKTKYLYISYTKQLSKPHAILSISFYVMRANTNSKSNCFDLCSRY